MEKSGCDYGCETVGESIRKYNIPNDWCAEFDVCDGVYPIICIPVHQLRKAPAMMGLKLRAVEKGNDEYAGCVVLAEKKTIAFKVDYMRDFVQAADTLKCL